MRISDWSSDVCSSDLADTLPQTVAVIETRAEPTGVEVVVADLSDGIPAGIAERGVFGVLLQYPGASGAVRAIEPVIEQAHELGAKTGRAPCRERVGQDG